MKIDSLKLMYGTFQSCRHALEDAAILVRTLHTILEIVNHDQMFIVSVPSTAINDLPPAVQQEIVLSTNEEALAGLVWSTQQQQLFGLVYTGTQELTRLTAANATLAIRSLGYALHVIPRCLQTPEEFDPTGYQFCFRIVAAHWNELSPEMQQILCRVPAKIS